jgi:hypothetical protein
MHFNKRISVFSNLEDFMKQSGKFVSLAFVVFFAALASAARADQIDNPAYKAWSSFKVGSTAVYDQKMAMGAAMNVNTSSTSTLKTIADDAITVELSTASPAPGASPNISTQKIPAKVDSANVKDDGTEDIKVGDKTYHCKVMEIKQSVPGRGGTTASDVLVKIWSNSDIPGGVVQETYSIKSGQYDIQFTKNLKSFEAK